MSLFQCENCGCVENTALSHQGFSYVEGFDWTGKEHLKGLKLCSACGPEEFEDGDPAPKSGGWHNKFPRTFLPKQQFRTNKVGNLEHIETGDEDYKKWVLDEEDDTMGPVDRDKKSYQAMHNMVNRAMLATGIPPYNYDDFIVAMGNYDTDMLRDDEQRIKDAEAKRQAKRQRRLKRMNRS